MAEEKTNVEKLQSYGLIAKEQELEPAHAEAINQLSSDELNTLINIHQRLGPVAKDVAGKCLIF